MAQSGPRNCTNGYTSFTLYAWNNPDLTQDGDGNYADCTVPLGAVFTTDELFDDHYGFAIPTGATIDGIRVQITGHTSDLATGSQDNTIRLMKSAATPTGNNLANGSSFSDSDTTLTYGGSTNLWGTTWTPAEINSVDFGVYTIFQNPNADSGPSTTFIDEVLVTVYYTPGGGGPQQIIELMA